MKRRSFFQCVIGGVVGLFVPKGKAEQFAKGEDVKFGSDDARVILLNECCPESFQTIDFDPYKDGKIVAVTEYRGALIVACERSVWQVIETDGSFTCTKISPCVQYSPRATNTA